MRKIINGKAYDTNTAEKICDVSRRGFKPGDFDYDATNLYRSPKGAFFIAGTGGARSRWGQPAPGGWTGGEGLLMIDEDRARSMVEEHGDPEDFIRAFGQPQEG